MSDDPFAPSNNSQSDPWSEPSNPAPPPAGPAAEVSADIKHPFSIKLTLKAADGYEAEWISPFVSGRTADEAAQRTVELLTALHNHGVIDRTQVAAQHIREGYRGESKPARGGGGGGGGGSYRRNQGGGQQQPSGPPPGVETQHCQHGEMVYRTGNGAKGPYRAWFCPTPQGAPDKCRPIFL